MDNENICWYINRDQAELGRRARLTAGAGAGGHPRGRLEGGTTGPAPEHGRDANVPVYAWGVRFQGRAGVLGDGAVPPQGWLPLGWRWPPGSDEGHQQFLARTPNPAAASRIQRPVRGWGLILTPEDTPIAQPQCP